jgi:hypothetical protein
MFNRKFKSWTPFIFSEPAPPEAFRPAGINLTGHYWNGLDPQSRIPMPVLSLSKGPNPVLSLSKPVLSL